MTGRYFILVLRDVIIICFKNQLFASLNSVFHFLLLFSEIQVFNGKLSDDGLMLEVEFQATSDITITCEFLYIQVDQDIFVTADNTNKFNIIG